MIARGFALATIVTAVACGGSAAAPDANDAPIDAPPGPCWPIDGTTPRGTIQLGADDEGAFVPMPDELHVIFGPQGGFHMPVHARATSIAPGNPADIFDPGNPRTRFLASFAATGERITLSDCGIRLGYKPANGSAYDLVYGHAVLFDVLLSESQVFDQQVRIVLEIIDSSGGYAKDEKVITTRAPVGWPMP